MNLYHDEKISNATRLREIVTVFVKNGFGDILGKLKFLQAFTVTSKIRTIGRSAGQVEELTSAVRLRMCFEELGPTFIKLGQLLANRADIFPKEFIDEFRRLRDEVPPFDPKLSISIIEKEFGLPIDQIFSDFDHSPLGAASMSQVHRATLKSGELVIVKIKRPQLAARINADIKILAKLAALSTKYIEVTRILNPVDIINEFHKVLKEEMDFRLEANNCDRFYQIFLNSDIAHVPKIYWQFTTSNVLTQEWLDGIDLFDLKAIRAAGLDNHQVATNGLKCFLHQILQEGFFHADPHSGNSFAMRDGRIGLIDFGMVGRIDEEMMEQIAVIFMALHVHNYNKLIWALKKIGMVHEDVDVLKLKNDIKEVAEPIYGRSLLHIDIGDIFYAIIHVALEHNIKIPRNMLMLFRSLMSVEGVAKELDSDASVLEIARPYARRLLKSKTEPKKVAEVLQEDIMELVDVLKVYPHHLGTIMEKLSLCKLTLGVRLTGLEEFNQEVDRFGNRIALTLLCCASVLGGSMIMNSNIEVALGLSGYPISTILGLLGYSIATIIGFFLVYNILRSGNY